MPTPIGWHFAAKTLRCGTPLPPAKFRLPGIKNPIVCAFGYHFSIRALDALHYAPGPNVARVIGSGTIIHEHDKAVAEYRSGLTDYVDASRTLKEFARHCALNALPVWRHNAPPVVILFLETGNPLYARQATQAATKTARRTKSIIDENCARQAAAYAANAAYAETPQRLAFAAARYASSYRSRYAPFYDNDVKHVCTYDSFNNKLEAMLTELLETTS